MKHYIKAPSERTKDTTALKTTVSQILSDIRERGDTAVMYYSKKFDEWEPDSFKVSEEEIAGASRVLPETFMDDVRFVAEQIRLFSQAQRDSISEFEIEMHTGIRLGQRLIPVSSVGNYIPGGRYPLVVSALMSTIPPKVAGVERIASFSPPRNDHKGIPPQIVFALHLAGSNEIYALGGVQAIGAMAYGTTFIQPVDMIVGPGNAYVAEAKRQVFGDVGIDLPAGPSEILIIADETANAEIVAADLLAQSEHDPNARAILITTSRPLAESVIMLLPEQLNALPTKYIAEQSWKDNGQIIVVDTYEDAAKLSDEFAIEHVEVQTRIDDWFLKKLRNYGSLFLGSDSSVVYSDKAIGTNHILPTMRAARYTGGLWVGQFLKAVTYQKVTGEGSMLIAPYAMRMAREEGMSAHAVSVQRRITDAI